MSPPLSRRKYRLVSLYHQWRRRPSRQPHGPQHRLSARPAHRRPQHRPGDRRRRGRHRPVPDHDPHLLRERQTAHRTRLHLARLRRPRALHAAVRAGGLLPHRHGRTRAEGRTVRGEPGPAPPGVLRRGQRLLPEPAGSDGYFARLLRADHRRRAQGGRAAFLEDAGGPGGDIFGGVRGVVLRAGRVLLQRIGAGRRQSSDRGRGGVGDQGTVVFFSAQRVSG
mmetsp:Transcript_31235/g.61843  ORF Transcript_31235/g.61843 Transcript_31235/m.61843 type:complete len:223 (+) Transcript_31235:130-798(+)